MGVNLVGWTWSKGVTFVIAILLSTLLGKVGVGRYAQALAILMVLELVALLPFGSGLMRLVAVQRDDPSTVRGTIRVAVGLTGATSAVLAAMLFAGAPWLARAVLNDSGLLVPLRLVAGALVPMALADALLNSSMGYQRMRAYALVKLVTEPAVRLGLLAVLVIVGLGAIGAVAALVVSCSVEAALAWLALRRWAGRWYAGPARYRVRELCGFSMSTGLGALAGMGLIWADSIILGVYRSSGDVGVYQVATRIMMLATFVSPALNVAFAPRIAAFTLRGEDAALRRSYVMVTTWTLRLSIPSIALLAVFTKDILRVFGPAFPAAAGVTLVLLLGALWNAWTGPGMQMLTMSGHPMWGALNNAAALTLNVALNLVLIPRFGVIGAAWAWTAALLAVNLARLLQVRRLLGMWPFSLAQASVVLIGLVSGLMAAVATHWSGWPTRLAVGVLVVTASYAVLTAMSLTGDDRATLQQVVGRAKARSARDS